MIRLYHQNLAYHLRRAAENARSILIVTPYVKIRAIEAIIPRGIRFDELTLVTRGAPDDFASGISDLDALDAVWSLGGEVYRFRIFTRSTTALTGSFSREARISRGAASAWGLIRNGMTKYSPLTSRAARVMSSKRTGGWPRYGFRGTQRGSFGNLLKDGGARVSFRTGSAGGRPRKRARSRGRDIRDLLPRDTDARFIQKLAAEDLAALVPPPALRSPEEMDLYIGTRLAGSPFLKTIQSLFRTETGPGRPFLSFGALKEMVRSPAFQAHIRAYDQVEVIARWLIYFLPDTYFIPSGLPFALGRRKRIPNGFRTEDQ